MKKSTLIVILSLFFFVTFLPLASAQNYYVSENGSGSKNGKSVQDAWSAAQFNSSVNWSKTEDPNKINPGDTVYFSGTFSTRLIPQEGGSSQNERIILDGYAAGDSDPLNSDCKSSALLRQGMWITGGRDYITVQDFRMTGGPSNAACLSVYDLSIPDPSDNIQIRRNYIYDSTGPLFAISRTSAGGGVNQNENLLIENNKMVSFGKGADAAQGVNIYNCKNAIIKNNIIGHGIGASTKCKSANVIEVHDSQYVLFEYNKIFGAPQQDGIAIKENGSQDIVIRFNDIHDNGQYDPNQGRAIGVKWPSTERVYIYGNRLYNNNFAGIDIADGAHSVFIWSNIFYNNYKEGVVSWFVAGREHGWDPEVHAKDLFIYNNIFAKNGTDVSAVSHTAVSINDGTNAFIKGNIFYDNRPTGTEHHQIYIISASTGTTTIQNNTYIDPGQTPAVYWGKQYETLRKVKNLDSNDNTYKALNILKTESYNRTVTETLTGLPVYSEPTDDTYKNAIDTSQAVLPDLTISGQKIQLSFGIALDPIKTDWDATPPIVFAENRKEEVSLLNGGAFDFGDSSLVNLLAAPSGVRVY